MKTVRSWTPTPHFGGSMERSFFILAVRQLIFFLITSLWISFHNSSTRSGILFLMSLIYPYTAAGHTLLYADIIKGNLLLNQYHHDYFFNDPVISDCLYQTLQQA
ncbi:hypothetical protein D3C72_1847300 [compost metagenome]